MRSRACAESGFPNARYRPQILDLDLQQGKSALRNCVLASTLQRRKKLDDTTDRDYRYTAATPLTLLEQLTLRLGTGPRPGHSLCTLVLTVVPIVSIALYVMPFTILVCVYLPDALVGSCPRHSTRSRFTSPTAGVPAPLSNLSIVRGTYTTASARLPVFERF